MYVSVVSQPVQLVSEPVTNLPAIYDLNKPLFPKPPYNKEISFPPVDKLLSTDLKKLDYLSSILPVKKYDIQNKINIIKRKPDKTQEDYNLLQDYL